MLTIHVVRHGGHAYYVDGLVAGRAQGTRVAGEEPGVWSGGGAAILGLAGAVEAPAFAEVLDGRHPDSGAALRRQRTAHAVAGYDLTFAAPKSVSILHLLAPREIATEVGAGHRAAVEEAIAYLDRTAVGVRRTRRGQITLLPAAGAVAGRFVHRTSRALDPHLHSHLVVANVTQGVDGKWSSLDSRRVFSRAPAVQGIYHARLRLELRQRLGAVWLVRPSGLGDVVGVDAGLRRLFSQRAAAMEEYEVGRFGRVRTPDHRRGTFHATRPEKVTHRTIEGLIGEWKTRAADLGYDLGDLSRVVGLGAPSGHPVDRLTPALPEVEVDRVRAELGRAVDHRSFLSQHDLVAVVAAASVTGATARTVESIVSGITEASGPPAAPDRSGGGVPPPAGRPPPLGVAPRWASASVVDAVSRLPGGMAREVPADPSRSLDPSHILGSDLAIERAADRQLLTPTPLDLGR